MPLRPIATAMAATAVFSVGLTSAQAAPPAAPNLSIGVDAAASKSSIDVAAADKILKGLRHELAANESLNSYLESVTGEAVPVGYTATQLTFREFGRDLHETDPHSWYAVFTYVLVDEAGDDEGGGRVLTMSYDAMQQRTASSGTELYSGNDELALAPARTFQQAAAEFDAFLAATFPGQDRYFNNVVYRQPSDPRQRDRAPLYIFHVAGDDDQSFYALNAVTGEIFDMHM